MLHLSANRKVGDIFNINLMFTMLSAQISYKYHIYARCKIYIVHKYGIYMKSVYLTW